MKERRELVAVALENQNGLFLHLPGLKALRPALASLTGRSGVWHLRGTHTGPAGSRGSWCRRLASALLASRPPPLPFLSPSLCWTG